MDREQEKLHRSVNLVDVMEYIVPEKICFLRTEGGISVWPVVASRREENWTPALMGHYKRNAGTG
jgi:hypothetical protein